MPNRVLCRFWVWLCRLLEWEAAGVQLYRNGISKHEFAINRLDKDSTWWFSQIYMDVHCVATVLCCSVVIDPIGRGRREGQDCWSISLNLSRHRKQMTQHSWDMSIKTEACLKLQSATFEHFYLSLCKAPPTKATSWIIADRLWNLIFRRQDSVFLSLWIILQTVRTLRREQSATDTQNTTIPSLKLYPTVWHGTSADRHHEHHGIGHDEAEALSSDVFTRVFWMYGWLT